MVTRFRYNDAATVSDEHGKGAEVLRQQVVETDGSTSHVLMVAEVDMLIRSIFVVNGAPLTGGTVRVYKRPSGGAEVPLTAAFALTETGGFVSREIPLSSRARRCEERVK